MRVLAVAAISALLLGACQFAEADPSQMQADQPVTPPADAPSPMSSPRVAVQETVKVTAPPSVSNLDEVQCQTSAAPTGTRLGATRECHTVREWEQRRKEAQHITDRAQAIGDTGYIPFK